MACIKISAVNKTAPHLNIRAAHICGVSDGDKGVPAEFSFRASGGKSIKDGAARIKRLKGNSVVRNQKYKPISNAIGTQTINGVTFTISEDGTVEAEGTAEGGSALVSLFGYNTFIASHKYLLIAYGAPAGEWGTQGLYFVGITGLNSASMITSEGYKIFQPSADGNSGLTLTAWDGYSLSCRFRPIFIDLTQMFGEGNEPTTIEEFNTRKPIVEDEYAYNAGEVIHMTAEGIKSVGDNAWDEQWENGRFNTDTGLPNDNIGIRTKNRIKVLPNQSYWCLANNNIFALFWDSEGKLIEKVYYENDYLPIKNKQFTTPANADYMIFYVPDITTYSHDIMITLVHSGWKQDTDAGYQPYWEDRLIFDQRIKDEFPDGMSKWDMVYNKDGKGYIVKGTGVVDMGDLDWTLQSFGFGVLAEQVRAINMAFGDAMKPSNCLCYKYYPAPTYDLANLDKVMRMPIKNAYNEVFTIKDTSYTDAATFKAAMAGVLLYYELAEPTIIEYDEPFNLDYRVADFGTEQAIAETNSAPISADIAYVYKIN